MTAAREALYSRLAQVLGDRDAETLMTYLPPTSEIVATQADVATLGTRLDGRMDGLEDRMERLEERMERLEDRMERLDGRMERLELAMLSTAKTMAVTVAGSCTALAAAVIGAVAFI